MKTKNALVIAAVSLTLMIGCSKPKATDVCHEIEKSSVGANCRAGTPGGVNATASERIDFDLPSVKGKDGKPEEGSVFSFANDEAYTSTERAYAGLAALAGPHRYGNAKARIFVQMNSGLSAENGQKVKAIVDGL